MTLFAVTMIAFTACMVGTAWFAWQHQKMAEALLVASAQGFVDAVAKAGGESALTPEFLAAYRNAQNILADHQVVKQ